MSMKTCLKKYLSDSKQFEITLPMLNTITFDDVCALIHLLTIRNCKVCNFSANSDQYLKMNSLEVCDHLYIPNNKNSEELAILMYILGDQQVRHIYTDPDNKVKNGELHDIRVFTEKYKMSNKFLEYVKKYKMETYPICIRIMSVFRIYPEIELNGTLLEVWDC